MRELRRTSFCASTKPVMQRIDAHVAVRTGAAHRGKSIPVSGLDRVEEVGNEVEDGGLHLAVET